MRRPRGDMPTKPAFCASRLAGPPKSKSLGVMIAFAPFLISSTATLPTVTGSLLPSRLRKAILRPSTPPFLLTSSTARFAPLTAGSSRGAWMPVRHRAPPMMIVPLSEPFPAPQPARIRAARTVNAMSRNDVRFQDDMWTSVCTGINAVTVPSIQKKPGLGNIPRPSCYSISHMELEGSLHPCFPAPPPAIWNVHGQFPQLGSIRFYSFANVCCASRFGIKGS